MEEMDMGFFSDLREDLSQAVNELIPGESIFDKSKGKAKKEDSLEALDEMFVNAEQEMPSELDVLEEEFETPLQWNDSERETRYTIEPGFFRSTNRGESYSDVEQGVSDDILKTLSEFNQTADEENDSSIFTNEDTSEESALTENSNDRITSIQIDDQIATSENKGTLIEAVLEEKSSVEDQDDTDVEDIFAGTNIEAKGYNTDDQYGANSTDSIFSQDSRGSQDSVEIQSSVETQNNEEIQNSVETQSSVENQGNVETQNSVETQGSEKQSDVETQNSVENLYSIESQGSTEMQNSPESQDGTWIQDSIASRNLTNDADATVVKENAAITDYTVVIDNNIEKDTVDSDGAFGIVDTANHAVHSEITNSQVITNNQDDAVTTVQQNEEDSMSFDNYLDEGMMVGGKLGEDTKVAEDENYTNRVANETAIITEGMTITGDINSRGSMDVEGAINGNIELLGKLNITGHINGNSSAAEIIADGAKINGEINSEGAVTIGASSVVIGNITAQSALIAGAVKGDIDVKGPVTLDASAIVMGNIKSKSVQINNGAVIEGMCSQCYADINPTSFFDDYKPEPKVAKTKGTQNKAS
jgi:cytoskeletal protein CcmA (bactofilin family)